MPSGKTCGGRTVRAARSAATSSTAPVRSEAGMWKRWSTPTSMRLICGATSPMKPTVPQKQITPAVASDARNMPVVRTRFTDTPRLRAASSPLPMTFKSQDSAYIQGKVASATAATSPHRNHVARSKLPSSQKTTELTCSMSPGTEEGM